MVARGHHRTRRPDGRGGHPRGMTEQSGRRAVVIVSHDGFNRVSAWRSIIVVPLSTLPRQRRAGAGATMMRVNGCGAAGSGDVEAVAPIAEQYRQRASRKSPCMPRACRCPSGAKRPSRAVAPARAVMAPAAPRAAAPRAAAPRAAAPRCLAGRALVPAVLRVALLLPAFRSALFVAGFAILLRVPSRPTIVAPLVAPLHASRLGINRDGASKRHERSQDTKTSPKTHHSLHAVLLSRL